MIEDIKNDIINSCLEDNRGIAILTSVIDKSVSTKVLRFYLQSDIDEFLQLDISKENLLELLVHEYTIIDKEDTRKSISVVLL